MALITSIDLSYEGIGQLLRSPEMLAEMERRARKVKDRCIETAPVGGRKDPHRGRYKDSFSVYTEPLGGIHKDRAEAGVINDSPEALYVEYGNRGAEPYRTMFHALEDAGGG